MTDTTRNDDVWDDDGEDDDEQTKVARNPLFRSNQAPAADTARLQARSLSSFGTPRSSWPPGSHEHGRPSLYDRLVQTGALDEDLADADKGESSRPLSRELQRSGSLELPPAPDLRELAEALEGGDGRDSAEQLRDSDLEMVAPASQIDTKPLRPLPTAMLPPKTSDSQAAGLRALPPPRATGNGQVSSILLGPGASMRNDATERFSHTPSTHPLTNSLAPSAQSVRPIPDEKRTPGWMVAAAALLLVGAGAAIGRYRSSAADSVETAERRAAATAVESPRATEPARSVAPPAPSAPVAEPAAPSSAVAAAEQEAAASPADDVPAGETPAQAKKRERDRRRAEREAERASGVVGTEQPLTANSAGSGTSAAAKPAPQPARVRPAGPTGPLLAQPTREQVVSTMDAMLPALAGCVGEKHGTASVTMTVRSTGTVSYALVGGSFAGTAEGSCIARVIKQAEFPAFSDASIRVSYPFQL